MSIGGIEQCDDLIAIMRRIEASGPQMAAAGTQALFNAVSADVAAGKDPNTKQPFEPTKKGTAPLKKAASSLSWRIVGNIGFIVLTSYYIFHFFGTGYLPKRRANLQGRIPDRYGDAMRQGMAPVFQAVTRKGKIGTKAYDAWIAKRGAK